MYYLRPENLTIPGNLLSVAMATVLQENQNNFTCEVGWGIPIHTYHSHVSTTSDSENHGGGS